MMILAMTRKAQALQPEEYLQPSENLPEPVAKPFDPSYDTEDLDVAPAPEASPMDVGPETAAPEPVPATKEVPPEEGVLPQPPPEPVLGDEFEQVAPLPDQKEKIARTEPEIRMAIWSSMESGNPLRIGYTTLDGWPSERTVHPDYVYWAGTRRHVLVGWDELRNDWRAFVIGNISEAKVEKTNEQQG